MRLTPPGAPKDTQHHVISLAGSGIEYRPGDALGIWPKNAEPLVDAILQRLGATGNEPVSPASGEALAFRDALLTKFELTNVVTEIADTSISPASRVCSTMGLALMLIISGSTPYFCNSFFS